MPPPQPSHDGPSVDLHGLRPDDALRRLERELVPHAVAIEGCIIRRYSRRQRRFDRSKIFRNHRIERVDTDRNLLLRCGALEQDIRVLRKCGGPGSVSIGRASETVWPAVARLAACRRASSVM